MQAFLAELYLPAAGRDALRSAARLARAAADALSAEGTPVRYVRAIFVPDDEICLLLFEAPSFEAVTRLAARAELAFDRIARADSQQ